MKKLMNSVIMTAMVLLVSSCGNIGEPQLGGENVTINEAETFTETPEEVVEPEKFFSYRILESRRLYYQGSDFRFGSFGEYLEHWWFDKGNDGRIDGLAICYGDEFSTNYVMFDDEEDFYNDYIYEWTMALNIAKKLYLWNGVNLQFCEVETNALVEGAEIEESSELYGAQRVTKLCVVNSLSNDTILTFCQGKAFDKYNNMIEYGDTISLVDYKLEIQALNDILNCVRCLPQCIEGYNNFEVIELIKKIYYDYKEKPICEPEKGYGYRRYRYPVLDDYTMGSEGYVELYRIMDSKYEGVPSGALGIRSNRLW